MTIVRVVPLPFTWEGLPAELDAGGAVTAKLERILGTWEGTPYMEGCQAVGSGGGVDCVRFVSGVLDALYGFQRVPIDRLPQDMALHRPESARAAMRQILRIYEPNVEVKDGRAQPGDVVIVGEAQGGPGHALIVGTRKNTLWHATQSIGVHFTGFGQYARVAVVHAVFRMADREQWRDHSADREAPKQ